MNKILREKIQEALSSVLPITLIVLVLSMTITPMPVGTLVLFLAGAVLLIVGMAFFSLGTDVSMTPMGEMLKLAAFESQKRFLSQIFPPPFFHVAVIDEQALCIMEMGADL